MLGGHDGSFLRRKGGEFSFRLFLLAARATRPEPPWHDACRLWLFVSHNNLPGGPVIYVEYNSELSGFRLSPVQAAFICGCGEGRQDLQSGIGHGGSGWVACAAAPESPAKIHPPFLRRKDKWANQHPSQDRVLSPERPLEPRKGPIPSGSFFLRKRRDSNM